MMKPSRRIEDGTGPTVWIDSGDRRGLGTVGEVPLGMPVSASNQHERA